MSCNASLSFDIFTADEAKPVPNATVAVTGVDSNDTFQVTTDESGRTEEICVNAPPKEQTLSPTFIGNPYYRYNAVITADGYTKATVEGIQAFDGIHSIEPVELIPKPVGPPYENMVDDYVIPENALQQTVVNEQEYDNKSPRILKEVIIPSKITVHLGRPTDSSAKNVTVSFPDYIKNVASSEIYPTWPDSSLRANIYAQISLALNRVFTEWYRSRGYNFDITNSTSYDQYYVHGRNIFENVSKIVDQIFNEYVRKQGTINPYYTEYCNGTTSTCKGMSQWGTVTLAERGYTPLNILKNYYGKDIELVATNNIKAVTESYPGTPLRLGSVSDDVKIISDQLNRIRKNYPAIPEIKNPGTTFDAQVDAAVRVFQKTFNLTQDGIVGKATWNKISYIFTAVKKLAELSSEGIKEEIPATRPTSLLKEGSRGDVVRLAQYFLSVIANYNRSVRPLAVDGIFGPGTKASVIDFQKAYGLTPDGIIGEKTWAALYSAYLGIIEQTGLALKYPGYLLKEGSRGDAVRIMQDYLKVIANNNPAIPKITPDGIFGAKTKEAVRAFQQAYKLDVDGIIGNKTWDRIVAVRLLYK